MSLDEDDCCCCCCCVKSNGRQRRQMLPVVGRIGLLLSICLIFGALHLFATPFPRRFFCTDQSLMYPMPASSTVPYAICAPVGVVIATVVILWLEVLRPPASAFQRIRRHWRRQRWVAMARWLYYFCLGCAATELLTVTAKLALGRHRPYFIEACRPGRSIADSQMCNSSSAYPVTVCRPTLSSYEFKDAQMSFPSGHTSYSLFVAAFLTGYLQLRLTACHAVRFCLQLCLLLAGLCVGYSRVSDYKHHWSDVLAGGVLGAALAAATLNAAAVAAEEAAIAAFQPDSDAAKTNGDDRRSHGANIIADSANSVGADIVEIVSDGDENDDNVVSSGLPRRKRLHDQAAIDAEATEAAAAAKHADEADRDSGNVEDSKSAVARDAILVARQHSTVVSNGVV